MTSDTALHRDLRKVLPLARGLTLAFVTGSVAVLVYGAFAFYTRAVTLPTELLPNSKWTPNMMHAGLETLGWTPEGYALYVLALSAMQGLICAVVGMLIVIRRQRSWYALLLGLEIIFIGVLTNPLFTSAGASLPVLREIREPLSWFGWPMFFVCFYLFPDGRFVPRWTQWAAPALVIMTSLGFVFNYSNAMPLWLTIGILGLILTALGSPIYRYFKVSDIAQKQQIKIVVLAAGALVAFVPSQIIVVMLLGGSATTIDALTWRLISGALSTMWMVLPIGIAIAVLRYRLWDIDVIVRRTLVYGLLSALLAGIYFGSVALLQTVITALTGQTRSELVTVVSTLAIAGLVLPLRNGLQKSIDRRFYRRKFNAEQALARFSAEMRDAVEMEAIAAQLMDAVEETLQPERIHVWIAGAGPRKTITEAQS